MRYLKIISINFNVSLSESLTFRRAKLSYLQNSKRRRFVIFKIPSYLQNSKLSSKLQVISKFQVIFKIPSYLQNSKLSSKFQEKTICFVGFENASGKALFVSCSQFQVGGSFQSDEATNSPNFRLKIS
jgi:hypothetical protein